MQCGEEVAPCTPSDTQVLGVAKQGRDATGIRQRLRFARNWLSKNLEQIQWVRKARRSGESDRPFRQDVGKFKGKME